MIKKLLLIPLMGIISFGAFASADTVDGFTSDSDIIKTSISEQILTIDLNKSESFDTSKSYLCAYSNPSPYTIYLDSTVPGSDSSSYVSNSNVYCFPLIDSLFNGGDEIGIYSTFEEYGSENNIPQNGSFYLSNSPITYNSSSDSDSSLGIPSIPESFTSGLTSLVNNFGGTIVNWLPTIILVALGIYAIFALFRVVRNYARSSFNG